MLSLGNGAEVAYAYDPQTFRLTRQRASRGAALFQDIQYTWDPFGNLIRLEDGAQAPGPAAILAGVAASARRDFIYDPHYRLTQASGRVHQALLERDYIPGTAGTLKATRHLSLANGVAVEGYTRYYAYDASSNLQSIRHLGASQQWTTTMWISATSNRSLPSVDPNGIAIANPEGRFDPAGHLIQMDHLRSVEWSWRGSLNRAAVIERADGIDDDEAFTYGADNQRVRKVWRHVVNGGDVETIEKVYLGLCERKRILRGDNVILERWTQHVSDGAGRIALTHHWTRDDAARETDDVARPRIYYQLTTHQGSSSIELDSDGNISTYEEYFPYGGAAFIAGDAALAGRKEYRYCGKERDDATSLYYYGFRYYAPWIGRWISPDPIGPKDDLNLYQFVLGDPVSNVDSDGLQTRGQLRVEAADQIPERFRPYFNTLAPSVQQQVVAGTRYVFVSGGKFQVLTPNQYEAAIERILASGRNFTHAGSIPPGNDNGGRSGIPRPGPRTQRPAPGRQHRGSRAGSGANTGHGATTQGARGHRGNGNQPPSGQTNTGTGRGASTNTTPGPGATAGTGSAPGQNTGPQAGDGTGIAAGSHDTASAGDGAGAGSGASGTGAGGEGDGPGAGEHGEGPGGGGDADVLDATSGVGAGGGPGAGTGTAPGPGSGDSPNTSRGTDAPTPGESAISARDRGGEVRSGAGRPDGSPDGVGTTPGRSNGRGSTGTANDGPSGTGTNTGGSVDPNLTPSTQGLPAPPGITENGTDPNGSLKGRRDAPPGGSPNGRPGGQPGGTNTGTSHGTHGGSPRGQAGGHAGGIQSHHPDALDTLTRWAGYANFEFGHDAHGQPRGIPGGRGTHNLGWFGQVLYIALTVVSWVGPGTILKGLRLASKFALRGLLSAVRNFSIRAAGSAIRNAFTAVARRIGGHAVVDPLVDANVLVHAHRAWRGSANAVHQAALALLRDRGYQWVITPTVFKEFVRVQASGASRRRFIQALERLGNTTVLDGATAKAWATSAAFRNALTEVAAVANRSVAGLGTRAGTATGKSFFNDIVQLAFARASEIPFATFDKKFSNFIASHAPAFVTDILRLP
jgi:RHS repeat-associated protein